MSTAFPLVTVIVAGIVYHLVQRGAGHGSPWPMLAVAYGAAFALALALAATDSARLHTPRVWGPGLLLGLAAFAIEAGFFFIYRSGWPLASASVIAGTTVTAVLALIGIAVFGDHLSAYRATGIALAAGGATLIARG